MAITTLNGALAGFQPVQAFTKVATGTTSVGRPMSWFPYAGFPAAGAYPNSTAAGGTYSQATPVQGFLPHTDPGSGNSYLGRLEATMNFPGQVMLCDRLWDNGGLSTTITTAQTVNSVAWPNRDANGASLGVGVMVGVEITVATSTNAPTITLSYTNSANTAGQTATNLDTTIASAPVGSFYRMSLASGDLGVRSIQSVTLSATWTAGTMVLVAYRVLATLQIGASGWPDAVDPVTGGFPQLFNGVSPFLIVLPNTANTYTISGTYAESQG